MTLRNYLGQLWFIHAMVLLGLFALWGYIESDNQYILLGIALSFLGALCGSFIRIINTIKMDKSEDKSEEQDAGWLN